VRIAILGGTFDPIHNGHLAAAQAVAEAFDIDEVQFIPTFLPPHKPARTVTSPFHRFAMVALATANFERFKLSTIEVDCLEARYSVHTLKLMHKRYADSWFVFIAGTDMYEQIESWKEYRELFDLTSFAVVNRPGFAMRGDVAPVEIVEGHAKTRPRAQPGVYYFPTVECDISSTKIREELRRGGDARRWIQPTVQAYINKHKLYA